MIPKNTVHTEMFDEVAAYLVVAPVAASVGLVVALALWFVRSVPSQVRVRAKTRRRGPR